MEHRGIEYLIKIGINAGGINKPPQRLVQGYFTKPWPVLMR
jgi:hypothetical protein